MTPGLLNCSALGAALLSLVCLVPAVSTAGQNPFKKLVGADKTSYQIYKDPGGRFQIDYPLKDWRLLPSGGASLAVFARNDGPALFVDHLKLSEQLTQAEVDAMPDLELGRLKEQQPNVKDFKTESVETAAGRGVLIRYSRVGKEPEAVMQCSVVAGLELYRLNGVVAQRLLSKNEPIIMHMIQSFKAPLETSTPKS